MFFVVYPRGEHLPKTNQRWFFLVCFYFSMACWPAVATVSALGSSTVGGGTASLTDARTDSAVFVKDTAVTYYQSIGEVEVLGKREGIFIPGMMPIKTEIITQKELQKAACCDLAGCFETQTTVQPQVTNVVTNAKELRILGLSGVYNQVLLDGFPLIQGLSYTYGLSSLPGPWVDQIFVSKGANSVLQGFESISGQINVETKEPDESGTFFANAYLNSFLEQQANLHYAVKKKSWSTITMAHAVRPARTTDRDGDLFMDLPQINRLTFYQKWKYRNEDEKGWSLRGAFRFLNEGRVGGQVSFDPRTDLGSSRVYGQSVRYSQPEFWLKTAYRIDEEKRWVLFVSGLTHLQDSYFGTVTYKAFQQSMYANLQYEYRRNGYDLKAGLSYRQLLLNENLGFTADLWSRTYAGDYRRTERIPGGFVENTFKFWDQKITLIAGIRSDIHQEFGSYWTPRTLLKIDLTPQTVLRMNAGTGWRTVQLFSENMGMLVSSRNLRYDEKLLPEQAFNRGINLTHKFTMEKSGVEGYWSVDYYRTTFQNQFFPDYDQDPTLAVIQNFTGFSMSQGWQMDLAMQWSPRLESRLGYNFLEVYRIVNDERIDLPFNPRHKGVLALTYQLVPDRMRLDINVHSYGVQRLPQTSSNPPPFRRPDFSDPYSIFNFQWTCKIRRSEWYVGCENLLDFRQKLPILSWENPFGRYFDTSSVWGPTRGREIYLGIRYQPGTKK